MFAIVFALSLAIQQQQQPCAGDQPSPRAFVQGLDAAVAVPEIIVGAGADCERGWVALRWFEITGERAVAERALEHLLRAARRSESAAWAYYGLGRLVLEAPWLNPGQQLVFMDAKSRARFAAREALKEDPTLYEAGVLLGEVSALGQDRSEIREARDLLRNFQGEALARVSPTIFELNIWLRDGDGMLDDAKRARAAGASPALVDRARTIALAEKRDTLAGSAYSSAIAQADSGTAMVLFDDVRAIISIDDTLAFLQGDLSTKREWLRSFWKRRAENTGETPESRVAEHYRRLLIVHERYAYPFRTNKGAVPTSAVLQPIKALAYLDDRALIYLRHGEPTRVQPGIGAHLRPNETWYYQPPRDGVNAFIFVPLDGTTGYRLVVDPLSVLDLSSMNLRIESSNDFMRLDVAQIMMLASRSILEDLSAWFSNHAEVDPRFGIIALRLNTLSDRARVRNVDPADVRSEQLGVHVVASEVAMNRRGALLAAAMGDSHIPKFTRDLNIGYDVYGFRAAQGTDVTVAIGIQAAEILDSTVNALRFRAAVQWRADTIVRADTAFNIPLSSPLPQGASIATTLRSTLPAGERPYFLTVATPGDHAGRQIGDAYNVRDFSGSNLMVSDLVIANAGRQGTWRRGSARLALVPHARIPVNAPFAIFYEVYNVEPGEEFETELYVVREDEPLANRVRGRRTEFRLRFTSVAALDAETGAMQELRDVQTAFEPGRYKLTVTVRRGSGETASAARTLTIL